MERPAIDFNRAGECIAGGGPDLGAGADFADGAAAAESTGERLGRGGIEDGFAIADQSPHDDAVVGSVAELEDRTSTNSGGTGVGVVGGKGDGAVVGDVHPNAACDAARAGEAVGFGAVVEGHRCRTDQLIEHNGGGARRGIIKQHAVAIQIGFRSPGKHPVLVGATDFPVRAEVAIPDQIIDASDVEVDPLVGGVVDEIGGSTAWQPGQGVGREVDCGAGRIFDEGHGSNSEDTSDIEGDGSVDRVGVDHAEAGLGGRHAQVEQRDGGCAARAEGQTLGFPDRSSGTADCQGGAIGQGGGLGAGGRVGGIDLKGAGVDRGSAAVGERAGEGQFASAHFGEGHRAANAILDGAGKGGIRA